MATISQGVNPTQVDTSQVYPLGLEVDDPRAGNFGSGKRLKYVKASAAVSAGNAVVVDTGDSTGTEPSVVVPASALNQVVAGCAGGALDRGYCGLGPVNG